MTVFVGRTGELQELERRLESARAGKGSVVFLTGDAGAGKSSLAERFLVEAALRAPDARVISAACSEQYGAGEPYQPFVEAFRDLLSGPEPAEGKPRLKELAAELAPYWFSAIPVAGSLIAAATVTAMELKKSLGGVSTAAAAPPSEEALFFQYTELFLAAAEEQPIVLLIDDLHWADQASVSLLGHLGRKIADKRVLILGTYRPADIDVSKHPLRQAKLELERYGVALEIALSPLDPTALVELVREELGAPPEPELVGWLERRAGSNPLFFTELLKWLVDQGYARPHHGEWVLGKIPEEIEIPRSAESAIEKRLGRLEPELYRVLEYASVEGNEFQSVTLSRLLDMDELALEETLEPLARLHRLIRLSETRELPNGDLASVYEFAHTLIQDVLHRNLQGKRRILLHRKIAEIVVGIYASDTATIAHKLALHYDEGRHSERAYEFALLAAERASQVFAHWDAIGLLNRALRNSPSDEARATALERLGDSFRLLGRYQEALTAFEEALQKAEARGDAHGALALKRKRIVVEGDHGHRSAQELLEELAQLAQAARELGARAQLCQILWYSRVLPGPDNPRAAQEALQMAEDLGDRELVAKGHYELGSVLLFSEDPARALPHLGEALGLYTAMENKYRAGLCHNCQAIAHVVLSDYAAATTEFRAAAVLFDQLGDPLNAAAVRNNLGALLTRMGDWDGAESNLRESIRLFQRIDASARLLSPLQNLAELYQAKGDWEAARSQWQALLQRAQDTGYWNAEVIARCGIGVTRLEEGDLPAARAEHEAARQALRDPHAWTESREACQFLSARLAAAEGNDAAAIEALEEAEGQLAPRDRYLWATFRLIHGEILARRETERARPIIEEALEAFQKLGAEPMRKRAEALLAALKGGP